MARGTRYLKKYATRVEEEDKNSFWMPYSDLMSALLLIFALFLMVSVLSNRESTEALEEKDRIIEERVGVKSKIIKALVQSFQDSNLDMYIDPQTGAITFDSGVFFETNSSTISPAGRKSLEQFVPKYVNILLSDKYRGHVSQIIIEGHTDTTGGYLYNLNLSQARALSVVQTIYSSNFPDFLRREALQKVITANGRSYSMPVKTNNGKIDAAKSRRVEFKFRLKDEELLDEIRGLVKKQ